MPALLPGATAHTAASFSTGLLRRRKNRKDKIAATTCERAWSYGECLTYSSLPDPDTVRTVRQGMYGGLTEMLWARYDITHGMENPGGLSYQFVRARSATELSAWPSR